MIQKVICVDPKFLNSKIKEHLYFKLCEKFINNCDEENGYIIDIKKDFEIVENSISTADCGVFFKINFNAVTFKPKQGDICKGKITTVFSGGIILDVQGKINVLIQAEKMKGYTFNKGKNVFTKGKTNLGLGSDFEFCIETVKYEKKKFNCIGCLKNI